MSRVTYFVRMTAMEVKAEEVEKLLLTNYERIKGGEPGWRPSLPAAKPGEFTMADLLVFAGTA